MLDKKCMCVCTTILPLFSDDYPNCAPQDKHPLWYASTPLCIIRTLNPHRCCAAIRWMGSRRMAKRQVRWHALQYG